jgi:hypothetical protein
MHLSNAAEMAKCNGESLKFQIHERPFSGPFPVSWLHEEEGAEGLQQRLLGHVQAGGFIHPV